MGKKGSANLFDDPFLGALAPLRPLVSAKALCHQETSPTAAAVARSAPKTSGGAGRSGRRRKPFDPSVVLTSTRLCRRPHTGEQQKKWDISAERGAWSAGNCALGEDGGPHYFAALGGMCGVGHWRCSAGAGLCIHARAGCCWLVPGVGLGIRQTPQSRTAAPHSALHACLGSHSRRDTISATGLSKAVGCSTALRARQSKRRTLCGRGQRATDFGVRASALPQLASELARNGLKRPRERGRSAQVKLAGRQLSPAVRGLARHGIRRPASDATPVPSERTGAPPERRLARDTRRKATRDGCGGLRKRTIGQLRGNARLKWLVETPRNDTTAVTGRRFATTSSLS
eukprot:scaffold1402_cov254-Pinguiococcus_pyrenoidosus.AAC.17